MADFGTSGVHNPNWFTRNLALGWWFLPHMANYIKLGQAGTNYQHCWHWGEICVRECSSSNGRSRKLLLWWWSNQGLNSAGSHGSPYPARSPSWDPPPKFGDLLEFFSAMSLLVLTHHDSYKYTLKTFTFQHVAVVVFGNRKMWRCSKTRCRSYLYSPTIIISFWNSLINSTDPTPLSE